jgi:hypothetical protein
MLYLSGRTAMPWKSLAESPAAGSTTRSVWRVASVDDSEAGCFADGDT